MAADKGKQFEYAVMLAAYGRIQEDLTGEVKSTFDTIMRNTNNGSSKGFLSRIRQCRWTTH